MSAGLEKGRRAIVEAARSGCDPVIVDEFGPLEMSGGGLRPAVDEALHLGSRLLVVVRESLVNEVNALWGPCEVIRMTGE